MGPQRTNTRQHRSRLYQPPPEAQAMFGTIGKRGGGRKKASHHEPLSNQVQFVNPEDGGKRTFQSVYYRPPALLRNYVQRLQDMPIPLHPWRGTVEPHPLLRIPSSDEVLSLAFDISKPHRHAKSQFRQTLIGPLSYQDLVSPAFTSRDLTTIPRELRLFFELPLVPLSIRMWVDISTESFISLGLLLLTIYNFFQCAIDDGDLDEILQSPGSLDIQNTYLKRCMPDVVQAAEEGSEGDVAIALAGGIRWIDALGDRTHLFGLTRAPKELAKGQVRTSINEFWIAHFR